MPQAPDIAVPHLAGHAPISDITNGPGAAHVDMPEVLPREAVGEASLVATPPCFLDLDNHVVGPEDNTDLTGDATNRLTSVASELRFNGGGRPLLRVGPRS